MSSNLVAETIAVTPTTTAELKALSFAFDGHLSPRDTHDAYDDELVGVMLGWHFRRIAGSRTSWLRPITLNLLWREAMAQQPDEHRAEREKYAVKYHQRSHPDHLLTVDGIDQRTLDTITDRAELLEKVLSRHDELLLTKPAAEARQTIRQYLRLAGDQQSIDLAIWARVRPNVPIGIELIEYPQHVENEIAARAQARAEHAALNSDIERGAA